MRRAVHLLFISHTFRFTKQLAKQQITIVVFAVLWVEAACGAGERGRGMARHRHPDLHCCRPPRAHARQVNWRLSLCLCWCVCGLKRYLSPCLPPSLRHPPSSLPSPVAATLVFDRPHFLSFLFHLFSVFLSHFALLIFHESLAHTLIRL